jgi:hypothetical protein
MSAYTAAAEAVEKTVKATVAGQHQRVRMEAAGMEPAEIAEAEATSAKLSRKLPALSQTTLMHMLLNARSIVGSFDEAAKIIEPLAKLRVLVQGGHPERAGELEEDFDKLQKAQEILGITQDPVRYAKSMQMIGKAMNVFGDTLRPYDFFEFAQRSRAAGQGFNDEFLFGVGPTLMQSMGGASAGVAMSALFQQFAGGHMTQSAAKMMQKYGLLDPKKIEFNKSGIIKRVEPGALKDQALFKAHPYNWMKQIFLPALRAHGITTKDQFEDVGAVLASKQTTGQALGILATQQSRIEKDLGLWRGAPGLEAADTFMHKDVGTAWTGLEEQLTNLMQVAGSPLALPAAANLDALAHSIGDFTQMLQIGPPKDASALEKTAWYADIFGRGASLARIPMSMISLPSAFSFGAGELGKYAASKIWDATKDHWATSSALFGGMSPQEVHMRALLSDEGPAFARERALLSDSPKVGGNATVTVRVEAGDQLKAHIDDVQNDTHGIDIKGQGQGTTGSVGNAWDDIGPVPGL